MRTKIRIVIATLVGAVLLMVVLLFQVGPQSAPIVESAPAPCLPPTRWSTTFIEDREPIVSQPERIAVAPLKEVAPEAIVAPTPKPPQDRIVALFESLGLQPGYWNAFHSLRSFTEFDLSRVRALVETNALDFGELMGAFHRLGAQSELRPIIVVACAFCRDPRPLEFDELEHLAGIDHDARTLHEGFLVPASSYAATLALWMLDGQEQLASVARESVSRYLDLAELENRENRLTFLQDSAALTLDALDVARGAELRKHVSRALDGDPAATVTEAAWRLHGRGADRDTRTQILEQARAGIGPARFGIEGFHTDSIAKELDDLARSSSDTEPGEVLASSACVALISAATSKSWRTFERISRDTWLRRPFSWDALVRTDRPQNLANLLQSSTRPARTPYERGFKETLEDCINATSARLGRCTVPRSVARDTCKNLRAVLSEIADDTSAMDVALRVLATHGDESDRRLVWSMSRHLSESGVSDVDAAFSHRR